MADNERTYAEGTREAAECLACHSPIWLVYHGPQANHTKEPRTPEQVDELIRAVREAEPFIGRIPRDGMRAALTRLEDALKPFPDPEPEGEADDGHS